MMIGNVPHFTSVRHGFSEADVAKQYQARGSSLRFSVKRDGALFVADFFSEDGDWLEAWAVPIHGTRLKSFKELCNLQAFFIENPEVWMDF